jgi:pimeloyl-ACP methyl ester carboxylesterase
MKDSETRSYADGHYFVTDGLKLYYRDYPGSAERPPLLCLHALTRNSSDFAAFAERYSPHYRVVVPDIRGRGLSDYDPLPARYNPLTYAADVLRLLDELAIEKALFVGTSLGGLVTMAVATMAPQRIAGAILNDVGPELSNAGLDRIMSYLGKDERFKSWDEAAEAIADNNRHLPKSYTHSDWLAMAHRMCRERNGNIVYDYDMAIAVPLASAPTPTVDLWPFFSALAQKPLLVVRGEYSDLLSPETFERMRRAAPTASFAEVPGVGHAPTLDEPEARKAIDAFLASQPK